MATLTTKSGITLEFEPLRYDETCLGKTRLTEGGTSGEGIWIIVSEKDKKDLEDDKVDGYFVAMLANDSLNFQYPSWGMHIVCKHNGTERPISDTTWVDYEDPNNRIFSPDCNSNESEKTV